MKNLLNQMIYRIVMCCVSLLAVLLTFSVFYVGEGPNDITWEFLKYYTNLSNYFVFAVSVIVLTDNVKRVYAGEKEGYNRKIITLKFMTTVMILVTFLVYISLLGEPFTADFWRNLGNLSYHVVAPLMFIIDYFLFEEKRSVSIFAPLLSLIIPLAYVCYVFILGAAIENFEYPYFFLDVNDLGYGGVMVWVVILVAIFTVLGYLLWLYNRFTIEDGKIKVDFKNLLWLRKPDVIAELAVTEESIGSDDENCNLQ